MTTRALQFEILAAGVQYSADLVTTPYVTFYAAGTDTLKDAWDDKDKSSSFTKLALDTQGRGVAYGDGVYKLKFYTGDPDAVAPLTGVLLFTIDNYKCQATTYGVRNLSANGTATPDDDLLICNGTFTVSLAAVATFEHPLIIKSIGTGIVAINPNGDETIDGVAAVSITNQYDAITLYPDTAAGAWRRSGDLTADLDAAELILDADGDTSITADTDDVIDFKLNGSDTFQMTTTAFKADVIAEKTSAAGVTIDGIRLKDDGIKPAGTQLNIDIGGTNQVEFIDGGIVPTTDNDVYLGIVNTANAGKKFVSAAISTVYVCSSLSAWNGSGFILQGKDVTAALHRKIIEIGDWNMDATETVNVAHGLTLNKIRGIDVLIINDAGTYIFPVSALDPDAGCNARVSGIDATNVALFRVAGSLYDTSNYDSTSYNRGWITIDYVD